MNHKNFLIEQVANGFLIQMETVNEMKRVIAPNVNKVIRELKEFYKDSDEADKAE